MRAWQLMAVWVAVLVVEAIALVAASRVPFSDDLQGGLRSSTPAYARYEALLEDYGRVDGDIVVAFEAEDFGNAVSHRTVAEFLIEVQFLDHVEAVISPFSFTVDTEDGESERLFDDSLSADALRQRLRSALETQDALRRVLSDDLTAMQAIVLTSSLPDETRQRARAIAAFEDLAQTVSEGTGVRISLAGYPIVRNAVIEKLDDDTALLNSLGVVVGLVVAWLTLRSLALAVAIALTAHTARLWSLTALMPLGFEINAVTITLPTLIVVFAFSEAIHLAMAARRSTHDGAPAPLRRAVRAVLPAAVLAALTTAGAFGALIFSRSDLVTDLALFGMLAVLISTAVTFGLFTLVLATLDRLVGLGRLLPPIAHGREGAGWLRPLARFVSRRAREISLAGVVFVGISAAGYAALEPDVDLFGGLSADDPEMAALERIETAFGPVTSILFEHPVNPAANLVRATAALTDLAPWGAAIALSDIGGTDLPEALQARVLSADGTHTLISLPYPYEGSAQAREDIRALEAAIAAEPDLRALGPASGVVHVSAFVSTEILRAFSVCFALAAAGAGLCVALWLRSLALGLLSVLPNVLPITVVGSVMWLADIPFDYTSGIALTIAFGIAVDDTVHLINRIRREASAGAGWSEHAILSALRGIGPTLVMTSAILIGGLSSTVLSSLPSLATFGMLTIGVFCLALLADLVLLPALFVWFARRRGTRGT